jgi:large subunit ribosomal protein L10
MPKSRSQKEQDLQELIDLLKTAKSVVFSEYRGTTVKDIDKFRKTLSKENVKSKVYKVTLIKKALTESGIDASTLDYKTPVMLSVSEDDETTPARLIKNISKDLKTISILSGIFDGQLASQAQMLVLADLPGKQELRAQLVGTINAPVSGFVNVLAANIRGLLNVLNAKAAKQ